MAARKVLCKLTHLEALYKFVNDVDGAATLTVNLATDLLKSNESLNGKPIKVSISAIETSIADLKEVSIVRNSLTIMNLFENTNALTFVNGADRENEGYDITLNFTGKGTVYMRLLKIDGYIPNIRPEQGIN